MGCSVLHIRLWFQLIIDFRHECQALRFVIGKRDIVFAEILVHFLLAVGKYA
jgi:hypothetical protein